MPRMLLTLAPGLVLGLLLASSTALVPGPARAEADPYRLTGEVVPTAQSVDLRLDAREADYEGRVRIELEVRQSTSAFRLHARAMDLRRVELLVGGERWTLSHDTIEADLVVLTAPRALPVGRAVLEIEFANEFDTRAHSLYRLEYEGEAYTYTQFEATDARGAFPCWDEPGFKIPWQMTLTVPAGHTAVSNTPIVARTEHEGWTRTEFARTPPLPSYLLAIATGPFDTVDIPDMRIPTRVVCPKGKADLAGEVVSATPPILAALERYFGRPYPYAKLDLIAVPEFWPGAMENPGAITYRDTLLLLDPAAVTVAQTRSLASVHAHELAHQWFGNLVTMQWWDDLWLNESFATWLGNKITHEVFPEYGIAVSSVEGTEGAKALDAKASTEAIRAPISADANLETMQAGITYQKGAAMLGMFEAFIGDDLFRDGVRAYIEANEWGNAEAADLFGALSEAAGVDVGAAMSTFVDQPGVPNVAVTVLGDGRLELSQSRFSNFGAELVPERPWSIPVVFRWSDGEQARTQKVLLTEERQVVDLPGGAAPEWIHPNADERGYYRWELEPEQLFALLDRAPEILSTRERVALVGALSAQLDAGRLGGGDYLRACGSLAGDDEPQVLDAALGALAKVRMAFVTAQEEAAFAAWVRATLRPALQRYGMVARPDEREVVALLRPQLLQWLGRWGGDEEVLAHAREVTQLYLEDRGSVDASAVGTCLQLAALDGDWKLYNAYKQAFEDAKIPAERSRFLSALGSFRGRSMQLAALDYAVNGPTRPQELFAIPMGVGTNTLDEPELMWNWFTSSYDDILEKIPDMFASYLPYFAGGCEEQRLVAAREFFARPEIARPGQDVQLERVAESVRDCAGLRRREGQSVREFLEAFARAD